MLFLFVYFSFCWVGLQHLPPAAYPIVNDYPFALLGIGAALIRYSRAWWLVPPVAFLSFMSYESATAIVQVGFAWAIYSAELPARRKLKLYLGLTAAILSYALLYLGWRLIFPSGYDGNQLAPLAIAKILRTWVAYTLGALPFAAHVPDIVWGDILIGRTEFHLPPFVFWPNALLAHPLELSFGLLTGWAVVRIYSSRDRSQHEVNAKVSHFLVATAATIAANFPLALSVKYQHLAQHVPSVYLTSRLALLPIAALVTILFGYLFGHSRRNFPVLGSLSCALLLLALVFSWAFVQHQNRYIAPLLRANLARWDAVATLMACRASGQLLDNKYAIPGIFYSIHVDEADWSGYFAQFAAYRFNQQVEFTAQAPLENSAYVRLDRLLDGTLDSLTVKTESGIHFISKADPEMRFLFDRTTHQALAIEAGKGQACGKSKWFIWHFDRETQGLSLDTIELVKSLPSGEAASVVFYSHLVVPKNEVETAVAALYRLYLGREADPGGLAFWSQKTQIAQGNLWWVIKEFEAIKGMTSAQADLEAAFQVAAKTCQPLTNQSLSQLASQMPEFARRWRLYTLICGRN